MIQMYANCIIRSLPEAERIVERLKFALFSRNVISILLLSDSPEPTGRSDNLAWLGGLSTLTIPNLGSLMAAGPILRTLMDTSSTGGSLSSALATLGISAQETQRYERRIREGGIWISVSIHDSDEVKRAQWIFENAGGEDVVLAKGNKGNAEPGRRNSSASGMIPKRYRGKRFGRLFIG